MTPDDPALLEEYRSRVVDIPTPALDLRLLQAAAACASTRRLRKRALHGAAAVAASVVLIAGLSLSRPPASPGPTGHGLAEGISRPVLLDTRSYPFRPDLPGFKENAR